MRQTLESCVVVFLAAALGLFLIQCDEGTVDGCTGDADCAALLDHYCDPMDHQCKPRTCMPKTCQGLGRQCGNLDHGCGGSVDCGTCTAPATCNNNTGKCESGCVADCQGRECGLDPKCGVRNCGTCDDPNVCNQETGKCECTPDCGVRKCGLDPVCGTESCGTCTEPEICNVPAGQCAACAPDCGTRECGPVPNGCGESCGTCQGGEICSCSECVLVQSIVVSPATATIPVDETQLFLGEVAGQNGDQIDVGVTWSSSDTSVATIDSSGLVKGVGAGTTTITATSGSVSEIATLTVAVTGPTLTLNPGESIQEAIDSLAATGGIVELRPGTYATNGLEMKTGVSLKGATSNREDVIISGSGNIQILGAENLFIKNLTISNTLYFRNGANILMDNVWIKGHFSTGAEAQNTYWVDNLTVRNSEFNKQVLTKNIRTGLFEDSKFQNAYAEIGLDMQENQDHVTVRNNLFTNNQQGLRFYVNNRNMYVYDNEMSYNERFGVQWKGNSNSVLRNNSIHHNGDGNPQASGLLFFAPYGMSDDSVVGNRIYDNNGDGITFGSESWAVEFNGDFTNNVIYRNHIGIDFNSWAADSTVIVKNNIISNNSGIGIKYAEGTVTLKYNDVWKNAGGDYSGIAAGTGDISEDPLFVGPAAGDFHLKSQGGRWTPTGWVDSDTQTSPAIDAGDPTSGYCLEPAPNGGRINMGNYGNSPQASKSLAF